MSNPLMEKMLGLPEFEVKEVQELTNNFIGARIKEARKQLHFTQADLAKKVGVKANTITNYETGLRCPSDAVIFSICRECNINEDWLRNGEGEMFNELSVDEEFIKICVDIQVSDDDFIKRLLRIYWGLDDATKATIRKLINDLADK